MILSNQVSGQFWVGTAVGGQLTRHVYKDVERHNFFSSTNDLNFHAGLVFEYQTDGVFGVHVEVDYLQMRTDVESRSYAKTDFDKLDPLPEVKTSIRNSFITLPLLAKASFGQGPLKFFLLGGPRLSYWLGGRGSFSGEALDEFESDEVTSQNFKVAFGELSDFTGSSERLQVVERANRLQYSIDLGLGTMFDITDEQRVMVQFRYSFGHSNMAFNEGSGFSGVTVDDYVEDQEYKNPQMVLSLAYVIGYNPELQRKGKSSSKK